MKKEWLVKTLALGIVIFFIVIIVIPAIGCLQIKENVLSSNPINKYILLNENDTTPPVTNISLKGNMSKHGIFTSDVEVTLNATDDLSGVNVTYYRLDIGKLNIYIEPFIVTGHGWHVLTYWSVDNAGNVEKTKFAYIEIDLIPPLIELYWYKSDNNIIFTPWILEQGSGVYKVEFYIDDKLMNISYDLPFEWIWTPKISGIYIASCIAYDRAENSNYSKIYIFVPFLGTSVIGLIRNPEISEENVSFFALIVFTNKNGLVLFKNFTFPNDYYGYIGKFFIKAKFF
jgi:hypothetical protein